MSSKEVEIKFLIRDPKALARKLRAAGFRVSERRAHESNTLYDLPGQVLRKRGELLRLRQYGKTWTLTHKGRGMVGRHKSRIETETELADGARMDAILRALGFEPTFRYEKYRTGWSDGKGHVLVDETPIGNVSEIEGPPNWIDRTAKRLGVALRDYITDSYVALFFAWKARSGSPAKEMTFRAVGRKP
ncbi:MAG TPA: class IV adenylate cyclase [Terriglobales bacterium]|nr:class IV adenylate cyclase [Terriglobales bacterium]